MAEAAAAMSLGSAVGGIFSDIKNAKDQAKAIEQQAYYQKKIGEVNTMIAGYQAKDAVRRGDREASLVKLKGRQLAGDQRAALAAQGLDIASGTAEILQRETLELSTMDSIEIKNNAWREAFGYKIEAKTNALQNQISSITAGNQARNTLISGGVQAATRGLNYLSKVV